MGMTIKSALEYLKDFDSYSPYQEAIDKVSTYIEQMQADYENRLKADKVAMLTEMQKEIEEKSYSDTTIIGNYEDEVRIALVELDDVNDIIQQKIDKLK